MKLPPQVTKPQIHLGTRTKCNFNKSPQGSPSQDCLKSLAFPEMNHRFNDIQSAARGTCEWLRRHEIYNSWAARDQGLFWIKGKPGSGKSTLLRHALENVQKASGFGEKDLVLSFFFHGRGNELQKTPLGLFRSLLYQILGRVPDALPDLVAIFQNWHDTIRKTGQEYEWRLSELQRFFESSLPKVLKNRPIWLFVDALDECGEENAASISTDFESWLQTPSLIHSRFHICFTCRHYPILDTVNASEMSLEHENKQDISTYVRDRLSISRELTASGIPDLITDRAEGVFMWARLVVQRILTLERRRIGSKVIEKEVYAIPPDLGKLYNEIISRMDEKPASLKMFQWICFAERPLTLNELRWAMIVDPNCHPNRRQESLQDCETMEEYIGDSVRMEGRVKVLSCGLAEIVKPYVVPTVQFIHQSVQDFLIEEGLSALHDNLAVTDINRDCSIVGRAHYTLSRTCIRYMAMKEIAQSMEELGDWSKAKYGSMFPMFPLLRYALNSWIVHVKQSEAMNVSQEDLLRYFEWPSESLVRLWLQIQIRTLSPLLLPSDSCLVHVVSQYQLQGLLRIILQRADQVGANMDAKNEHGRTPLSYAAENGDMAVVKPLIERHGIIADSKDKHNRTPLSYAAESGHEAVVKLFIARDDDQADSKDDSTRTPLAYAVQSGHEAVVKLLIARGDDKADSKDSFNQTALLYSARYTRKRILSNTSLGHTQPES